jgi:23S rRNA pseudouridine1911/1915/1917 synthase
LTLHFTADRGDARLRLDQVLTRRIRDVAGMSRARAQNWIKAGLVSVDETPAARPSIRVHEGAAIHITLPEGQTARERPQPEPVPLDVLYEDEHLIALNKPAGMVVHPSYRNTRGTLLNGVLWRLQGRDAAPPGLVSRLDKNTSGVVLVALSAGTHARLQRAARAGQVRKQYLAVVRGLPRPTEGVITLPLQHDPADRRRMAVASAGRGAPSETRYRVVAAKDGYALVLCELVTGRTHQIRVHLSASGWPLLGDALYGGEPGPRHALHAWRLTFPHPVTHTEIHIEAPVPPDFGGDRFET